MTTLADIVAGVSIVIGTPPAGYMPPPAYAQCCVLPRGAYAVGAPWWRRQEEMIRRYGPPVAYAPPAQHAAPSPQTPQAGPPPVSTEMQQLARQAEEQFCAEHSRDTGARFCGMRERYLNGRQQ